MAKLTPYQRKEVITLEEFFLLLIGVVFGYLAAFLGIWLLAAIPFSLWAVWAYEFLHRKYHERKKRKK
jgi:fatty acid desaturase